MQSLVGSCVCLHQLYLQIHSLFPPSLSAVSLSDEHKKEIADVFLVVLEALMVQFLTFRPFMKLVLSEFQDLPPENHFPHCMLLINIVNKLPSLPDELQVVWCSSCQSSGRMSLFQAVIQSFARCSPEIAFPVLLQDELEKGQSLLNMTFYQYVCTHLCACIALLPPGCFAELEHALLNAVLSHRMLESLLAVDVWCFLARYGTVELCAHHVEIIALLVKSSPSNAYQLAHLTVLLRRLLFLMDYDGQVEFINLFPPTQAENVSLWSHVSLASLSSSLRSMVETGLLTAALFQCRNLLQGSCTPEDINNLNVSLSAMSACQFSERNLGAQQSDVIEIVLQLWSLLSVKQICEQPSLQEMMCLFLDLFGFVINKVDPAMLKQVLSLVSSLCKEDAPSHVKLAVLDFLLLLGKMIIPQEDKVAVLSEISGLFSLLLADNTWIIKQHALEAFTQFAK
ncbi:Domain of unknown function (DUF4487), partial [Pristimantis euphronides]